MEKCYEWAEFVQIIQNSNCVCSRVKTFAICKKTDETNNFRCDICAVAWIGTEIFTDWMYRRSVLNKRLQIRRAFGIDVNRVFETKNWNWIELIGELSNVWKFSAIQIFQFNNDVRMKNLIRYKTD